MIASYQQPPEAPTAPTRTRRSSKCDKCGQVVPNALVIDDDTPQLYEGCWSICRRFYCKRCHHVACWIERVDDRFRYTGDDLTGQGHIRSDASVGRFLSEHPIVLMEVPV